MIPLELSLAPDYTEADLLAAVRKKLGRNGLRRAAKPLAWQIVRKSLDARDKSRLRSLLRVSVYEPGDSRNPETGLHPQTPARQPARRPVVIGLGPAGLFAAWYLTRAGLRPIIVEQGRPVEKRAEDVRRFWSGGELDEHSNAQFGEGGAGTFSDGKLHTGVKSPWIRGVFETLVAHGAPEDILYSSHPHIGTDLLPGVLRSMRHEMEQAGATFLFSTEATDFRIQGGALTAVELLELDTGRRFWQETEAVFLGIGHSSRRTYLALDAAGVPLESKPMAVGVRIEHEQLRMNETQYGRENWARYAPRLGACSYKLTAQVNGRAAYSFCMCPGGEVIACSSAARQVVTNGMSRRARETAFANSALLVSVGPEDYAAYLKEEHPEHERLAELRSRCEASPKLAGLYFQESLEYRAFLEGGSDYRAPSTSVSRFLHRDCDGAETPTGWTYPRGITESTLEAVLPEYVMTTLQQAFPLFEKKIPGFATGPARLYAIESRSSSPLRILRDSLSRESAVSGLYPIGEGAGYAGGITSSAVDGVRSAEAYRSRLDERKDD